MIEGYLIGVDVGGTKIAAGVVDPAGTLLDSSTRPTPATEGPEAVLDAIAAAIGALPRPGPVVGVGVGTGGVVDRTRGVVVSANVLLAEWAGTEVAAELSARAGVPVAVDNDVNAFALAEQRFGAGAGRSCVLYASAGTGIGGALVFGGSLIRGAHHTAGELGHIAVPEAEFRPCNCGRIGHLEGVASGPAMVTRYQDLAGTTATDLPEVVRRAADGENTAAHVVEEGAAALGKALAGLVNTVDPELVVLGGGVAEIDATYWGPLRTAFRAELLPGPREVPLVPAALGSRAAVVGAAALHLENQVHTEGRTA